MELLVHFVYCQNTYFNGLNSGAKFKFNTFKMIAQNVIKFVSSVMEKV